MSESEQNLTLFQAIVQRVGIDKSAERSVRAILKGCAESCPIDVLVHLGDALVDARRREIHNDAELN